MTTCLDKSDQVFIMNKPCTEDEFVQKYNASICSGLVCVNALPGVICSGGLHLHKIFSIDEYEYCHKLDDIIRDHNTSYYWNPQQCLRPWLWLLCLAHTLNTLDASQTTRVSASIQTSTVITILTVMMLRMKNMKTARINMLNIFWLRNLPL